MSALVERWEQVEGGISAACQRAGRAREEVGVVAVSKTFGPDAVAEAVAAGLTVFGENKVQEAAQKIPQCAGRIEWHLIGHLQSNKVRPAVGLFRMLHAVDSWTLLERIDHACDEQGVRMPVCLEVNVSGERSKFGLPPAEVPGVLARSAALLRVQIVGLMTMPPFDPNPEKARPFFRELRRLRDAWRAQTGHTLEHLSMGMSMDYPIAIEEGATWIRLGSCIFGDRPKREPKPENWP